MSDFKAKMHQIRFRWGSLQHSPDPLAGFEGPTRKGREGMRGEGRRKTREGRGRKRGGEGREEKGGERPF